MFRAWWLALLAIGAVVGAILVGLLVKNSKVWPLNRQRRVILVINGLAVAIGIVSIVGSFLPR